MSEKEKRSGYTQHELDCFRDWIKNKIGHGGNGRILMMCVESAEAWEARPHEKKELDAILVKIILDMV